MEYREIEETPTQITPGSWAKLIVTPDKKLNMRLPVIFLC